MVVTHGVTALHSPMLSPCRAVNEWAAATGCTQMLLTFVSTYYHHTATDCQVCAAAAWEWHLMACPPTSGCSMLHSIDSVHISLTGVRTGSCL